MNNSAWTPNLIMPGVAKCGTTTLHDLLVSHPQVQSGHEKEVRFLMDENETQPRITDIHKDGIEGWRALYPLKSKPDAKVWIDATPQYQYQETAPDVIASLAEKPRIIFIIRRPSDRLYSMYQYAKYHQRTIPFIADFPSFVSAIRDQPDPRLADQTMLYHAWKDTDYAMLCDTWSALCGKSKFMCVSLEDLIDDQSGVLREVAEFTGIDPRLYPAAADQKANPTVVTKSRTFRIIGSKVARHLPDSGIFRILKDFGKRLNSGKIDKSEKADNHILLSEIDAHFAPACARVKKEWNINRL